MLHDGGVSKKKKKMYSPLYTETKMSRVQTNIHSKNLNHKYTISKTVTQRRLDNSKTYLRNLINNNNIKLYGISVLMTAE